MLDRDPTEQPGGSPLAASIKIASAVAFASALCVGVYFLLEAIRPAGGLISFAFLLVLPAGVSGFLAYVGDPWARRSLAFYLGMPFWVLLAAVVAAFAFLREGVICVIMLAPLWLLSGLGGATLTYHIRTRLKQGRLYCSALILAPLLCVQLEPMLPTRGEAATVSRAIVVNAPPEKIWPLLRGIPDVKPGEGRWNISQDLVGLPRPIGAVLLGNGTGAERLAAWDRNIRFRERITEWEPGRRIGWRFIFDDPRVWDFTDRHLRPDSPYFRVLDGGYTMTRLGPDRTRLEIDTRYWLRTPVNGYSRLWGELFLGDIENNLLVLIKARAEARA